MTAAPTQIKSEFEASQFLLPIDDKEIIHYETKQVIRYTNLDTVLSSLNPAETGLLYVPRIGTMMKIEQTAREMCFNPMCV